VGMRASRERSLKRAIKAQVVEEATAAFEER
jgi:hypothetical protein